MAQQLTTLTAELRAALAAEIVTRRDAAEFRVGL
jgi:hypothetical protein